MWSSNVSTVLVSMFKSTEGRLGNILPPKDVCFLRNPRVIEMDGKFLVLIAVMMKT